MENDEFKIVVVAKLIKESPFNSQKISTLMLLCFVFLVYTDTHTQMHMLTHTYTHIRMHHPQVAPSTQLCLCVLMQNNSFRVNIYYLSLNFCLSLNEQFKKTLKRL